ncbi:MAG: type II/IV secretion system-related protein [Oligoflexia bacterium]|nr:MAG: type II/IV secretion system-related protein [Oligoflexia bacterium]
MKAAEKIREIEIEIQKIPLESVTYQSYETAESREQKISQLILEKTRFCDPVIQKRVLSEFESFGPIDFLLNDPTITEVLINSPQDIWFEKTGELCRLDDSFTTELTYRHFIERLCLKAQAQVSAEYPIANGHLANHRLHIAGFDISGKYPLISLRRHPENPWTFEKLIEANWCSNEDAQFLEEIMRSKENFIVIGGTGSGKTSVLNACLQKLQSNERAVIIEDTPELKTPNTVSAKLVTRPAKQGILAPIDQAELVRQSLRMRPDRIVVGEVRGPEAKDLLLALSTGHSGSFGSLHAMNAHQALLRLEMLIQLGAPQWSLRSIRSMIHLSLKYIVTVGRTAEGKRCLREIHQLSSLEESGILLDRVR